MMKRAVSDEMVVTTRLPVSVTSKKYPDSMMKWLKQTFFSTAEKHINDEMVAHFSPLFAKNKMSIFFGV